MTTQGLFCPCAHSDFACTCGWQIHVRLVITAWPSLSQRERSAPCFYPYRVRWVTLACARVQYLFACLEPPRIWMAYTSRCATSGIHFTTSVVKRCQLVLQAVPLLPSVDAPDTFCRGKYVNLPVQANIQTSPPKTRHCPTRCRMR